MLSVLWSLLWFVVCLGIMITIHEYGHFWVARRCGVKIYRFSLGFGPILFRHRGKDGTEYALSAIPLGGYVKMKGEVGMDTMQGKDPQVVSTDFADLVSGEDEHDAFSQKTVLQRMAIAAAGPLMNILLALVCFIGFNMMDNVTLRPAVGGITPGSLADGKGIAVTDVISQVGNNPIQTWANFDEQLIRHAGEKVEIHFLRDLGRGEAYSAEFDLSLIELGEKDSLKQLGLSVCYGEYKRALHGVQEGSPADKAGVRAGDIITSIDGVPTPQWQDVSRIITENTAGLPLDLVIDRQGEILNITVTPEAKAKSKDGRPYYPLGIMADITTYPELLIVYKNSLWEAIVRGAKQTVDAGILVCTAASKMISGDISPRTIGGPMTIANVAGHSADYGLGGILIFVAIMSMNLGILNLLPIPVLDGGQLLFLAYEGICKQKPSQRWQTILTTFGISIVLGLTFFSIVNDFFRYF